MTENELPAYLLDSMIDSASGFPMSAAVLNALAADIKETLEARYVLCHVHDMILHCDVFPHSAKAFRMTRKLNMVVA